jgi:hypothetical protein
MNILDIALTKPVDTFMRYIALNVETMDLETLKAIFQHGSIEIQEVVYSIYGTNGQCYYIALMYSRLELESKYMSYYFTELSEAEQVKVLKTGKVIVNYSEVSDIKRIKVLQCLTPEMLYYDTHVSMNYADFILEANPTLTCLFRVKFDRYGKYNYKTLSLLITAGNVTFEQMPYSRNTADHLYELGTSNINELFQNRMADYKRQVRILFHIYIFH